MLIVVQCKLSTLLCDILGNELRQQNVTRKGARETGWWEVKSGRGRVCPRKSIFFLFKDLCTISMSTSSTEIVSKQGKGVLLGLRKYCLYREKKA